MKTIVVGLLMVLPFLGWGQVDTVAFIHESDSLLDVIKNYENKGEYQKVIEMATTLKDKTEKVLGSKNIQYVNCLSYVASSLDNLGNLEDAAQKYNQALIINKELPNEQGNYCAILGNLAIVYKEMGRYEIAESTFIKAKNYLETHVVKDTLIYGEIIGNLAGLYQETGYFEKAELFYILVKKFPIKKGNYPAYLNNLALIYQDMGRYKEAESLLSESRSLIKETFGLESVEYVTALNNIASLYIYMKRKNEALPIFLEAKDICEKVVGKEHWIYGRALNNLGWLHQRMLLYDVAEQYFLNAREIWGKFHGKNHPNYARSLHNLAYIYQAKGCFEEALEPYLEAKNIRYQTLGPQHPTSIQTTRNLGSLYWKLKRYDEAFENLAEECTESKILLLRTCKFLSAKEVEQNITLYQRSFDLINSLGHQSQSIDGISTECFNNTLFSKGFGLEISLGIERITRTLPGNIQELYEKWKSYNRLLSKEFTKPIRQRSNDLAQYDSISNSLEKVLVHTIAGYGELIRKFSWQQVRDALNPTEAALEFIHFRYHNPDPTDSTFYAALLLLPAEALAKEGRPTVPIFIPLCEQRQLQALLHRRDSTDQHYQNLYRPNATDTSSLWQAIWAPIAPYLSDKTTVYFSPSGLLHRINLGAIQPAQGQRAGDRYQLVQLGSTRQLVADSARLVASRPSKSLHDAILFGGIQYELDTVKALSTRPVQKDSVETLVDLSRGLSFAAVDSTVRGSTFKPLPGTLEETNGIAGLLSQRKFKPVKYQSATATEEVFKQIGQGGQPPPRVLHIATHGFFFSNPEAATPRAGSLSGEAIFRSSDNPMIRSGLALAGANYAWTTSHTLRPDMEDGILTAYEISQMNLSNTELVVLSACETGLGDLSGNEGVYGLQRAFKIAGAKYLIMSLWQVPDAATSTLMQAFYSNWLGSAGKKPMSIPVAFREAQKTLQKADSKFRNPYYWAGFVLVE